MPAKRKQTDDATEPTAARSTRATTTRSTGKQANPPATTTAKRGAKKASSSIQAEHAEDARTTKKARTVAAKKTAKAKADIDDSVPKRKSEQPKNALPIVNPTTPPEQPAPIPAPAPAPQPVPPPTKKEPYTAERAQALFKHYADPEDPKSMGADGFEKLCTDARIALDGPLALLLAWQFQTGEMMKITNEEWTRGTSTFKIASTSALFALVSELEALLMQDKKSVKPGEKNPPYDRTQYFQYAADPKAAFLKFYMFCFNLVKPPQSKNIDMETSAAFWSVLLVPKYPIMQEVLDFIAEKGGYKASNKDLWSMMLEFCQTVNPSLSDYEADGAWPTLLDDFVAWKRSKTTNGSTGVAANGDAAD